jgi:hypothetical protein
MGRYEIVDIVPNDEGQLLLELRDERGCAFRVHVAGRLDAELRRDPIFRFVRYEGQNRKREQMFHIMHRREETL